MINFNKSSITTRGRQHLFLNNVEVSGVQNATISYQIPKTPIRFLGVEEVSFAPDGSTQAEISVDTFIVGKDYFLDKTGENPFNGYVLKDKRNHVDNFSFRSGFLFSHSVSCSIGQMPTTQSVIRAFGGAGRLGTGDATVDAHLASLPHQGSSSDLKFISPGSIEIEFSDLSSNRINSFQISYITDRQVIYGLGNKDPKEVVLKYPVPIECKFNIDVMDNGYVAFNSTGYPCVDKTGNLTVKLNDMYSDSTVVEYHLGNVHLVGESYSTSANGPTTMDLMYRGFIKRPN